MAIDLKKMRAKLASTENKGGGSNKNLFWKPTDGESVIRIVPDADGDPFKEYWFHYNVANNPGFLSPKKNFGEEDVLDKYVRKLFNEGTEESREEAKKLMAKQRFFSPVIVRGEEEKGVRLWGYSKTVYQKLLQLVLNPEYGDITDPEEGTDLTINYGKKAGQMFPSTDIFPARRTSALHKDRELAKELVETEIQYDNVFTKKTTDEVQQMLEQHLSGDTDDSQGTMQYSKPSDDAADQAFKSLLSA
tara:strand:- start:3129 stop:3869 length:741 start_codon:yes stop_codon:yes gene_type:complete